MSDKAKKNWYATWWGIALIIFFAIGFLSYISGPSESNAPTTQPKPAVAAPPTEVAPAKVGDFIQAGDFKWRIVKVEKATQVGQQFGENLIGKKASGEYLIVSVEVENTGKSAKILDSSFLRLVDDQTRTFSPDTGAAIYLGNGEALMFETVNPGIVKKGKIVFDVPLNLKVANLKIAGSMADSGFSTVQLLV